jgi:BioD-like phosphotransacetylase family protein
MNQATASMKVPQMITRKRLFSKAIVTLSNCPQIRHKSTVSPTYYEDEESYSPSRRSTSPSSSPVYVAATRQNVGKTSTSLALLSGLQKRFDQVGFMKPVGQQSLTVEENGKMVDVDKDAVLVKHHFKLDHLKYQDISPVLIPKGYTRDYLDGKIRLEDQKALVNNAYKEVSSNSEIVLCEGTGHCAVGSIVHASNAQVAKWLDAKMILVANGGLGNTFDELELNKVLCDKEGVEICGVIVNKVHPAKLEQTRTYISKALDLHWGGVPLLGCVPDRPFLGHPALSDLERLFQTKLLTGEEHRLRHYTVKDVKIVAESLQVFLHTLRTNPSRSLYVCHASRNDILLGFLMESRKDSESALVVTGTDEYPLSDQVMDIIHGMNYSESAPPVLLAPYPTNEVMDMIHRYTPKLNFEDASRATTAVNHYEPYIDFDLLLERTGHSIKAEHQT